MKTAVNFQAETRAAAGKGAARALRRQDKIPAILYTPGEAPVKLALPSKDLTLAYKKGGFMSRVVSISIDGKTYQAIPREVQTHPVSDKIEHADFQRVTAGEKVKVEVPVRFLGADKSAGLKRGGVLNIVRHELELYAAPEHIPVAIEIDISALEIGDSVHINDVKLPADVTPTITNRNFTIATIAGRAKEEEEAKPVAAAEGAAATTVEGAAAAAPAAAPAKDAKK